MIISVICITGDAAARCKMNVFIRSWAPIRVHECDHFHQCYGLANEPMEARSAEPSALHLK
jgi:hypothetical protein